MSFVAHIRRHLPILLTFLAGAFFVCTLQQYRIPPASERYKACLAQAKDHPQDALHTARTWLEKNPSSAVALHCEGMALYQMKHYAEASVLFEDLAHKTAKDTPDLAVTLLLQAAQSRTLSNDSLLAVQDLDYALTLSPDNAAVKKMQADLTKKP